VRLHGLESTVEEFEASDAAARRAVTALRTCIDQVERPGLWPPETRREHLEKLAANLRIIRERALTPVFLPEARIFIDGARVTITTQARGYPIRYTLDGKQPTAASPLYTAPLRLEATTTIKAQAFPPDTVDAERPIAEATFSKVEPLAATSPEKMEQGVDYAYYEGEFWELPDFSKLSPPRRGQVEDFTLKVAGEREEHYAIVFTGYLDAPSEGVYTFYVNSDDGSRLYLHDTLVVDNDQQHGPLEQRGTVALAAGRQRFRLEYFQLGGGKTLEVFYAAPGEPKRRIPPEALWRIPDESA
jgi:hypothetical protein